METRLYSFTPFHLSGIQKGIQTNHSCIEYMNDAIDRNNKKALKSFMDWATKYKTIIILNGGSVVSMQENIIPFLKENKVFYSVFKEPDLNDLLTSITIIVDEKVWNDKKYPLTNKKDQKLRSFLRSFDLASN